MKPDAEHTRPWATREGPRPPIARLARANRATPTDAERKLWRHLRRLEIEGGGHFRRQVVIGRYVADFACHSAKLIIEVDGGQHCESAADDERTKVLAAQGWRVLRFWNSDVLGNLEGVAIKIAEALAGASLPPCGGGPGWGVAQDEAMPPNAEPAASASGLILDHPHPRPLPARGRGEEGAAVSLSAAIAPNAEAG